MLLFISHELQQYWENFYTRGFNERNREIFIETFTEFFSEFFIARKFHEILQHYF